MDWERYNELLALNESGKNEESLSGLRSLVNKSETPDDKATALLGIASILRTTSRSREAMHIVAEAFSLLPRRSRVYPKALFMSAAVDIDRGEWKLALKKLKIVKSRCSGYLREPGNAHFAVDVQRHRGIALVELGRYKDALPLLEAVADDDCWKDATLFYLGRCFYALGKVNDSKNAFQEVLKLNPHPYYESSAHDYLSAIYYGHKQYAWARQELEWCLDHAGPKSTKRISILTCLVNASRALGLVADAQRYSDMLRHGHA